MIDAINTTSLSSVLSGNGRSSGSDSESGSGFDAALQAAQRDEQRQQEHQSLIDSIKSKGFTAWARDEQIEALKEKLRKQVMADMGISKDDLSKMSSVIQQILQQKIEEEVDRRMQEEMAKQQDGDKDGQTATASTTATSAATATQQTTTQQPGKNDRDGNGVQVIPALSWPGAASLF